MNTPPSSTNPIPRISVPKIEPPPAAAPNAEPQRIQPHLLNRPASSPEKPPIIEPVPKRSAAPSKPKSRPAPSALWVRVGIFVALAACVALVWWSVSRRLLPATRELRDKAIEMARLANEVQQLELNWNAAEVQRTEERFQQAQALVVRGQEGLLGLKQTLARNAEGLALEPAAQSDMAQARSVTNHNLSIVPITLNIKPLEIIRTTNTPYRRLLSFTRLAEKLDQRIDLVDLSITGNSRSVHEAKLVFDAWAQEPAVP